MKKKSNYLFTKVQSQLPLVVNHVCPCDRWRVQQPTEDCSANEDYNYSVLRANTAVEN